MLCETNDFDCHSRDFKVNCCSTWKQSQLNPINSKQSWASLWVACRTKCLVWDSSPYIPSAICSPSSNFAAASTYAAARKKDVFIADSKDSTAVQLFWCLLCTHPSLRRGTGTEDFSEVYGQKRKTHPAKASPEPHLTGQASLWKPPQAWSKHCRSYIPTLYHFAGKQCFSNTAHQGGKGTGLVFRGSWEPHSSLGPRRTGGAAGSCGWPSLPGCWTATPQREF